MDRVVRKSGRERIRTESCSVPNSVEYEVGSAKWSVVYILSLLAILLL